MEQLWQDLRFGARMLTRWPAVTAAALVALALGTGVNTALFSIVHAVLLRPLPFPDAHRLVQIWRTEPPSLEFGSASFPRYVDWRARGRVFAEMGAFAPLGLNLTGEQAPERLIGAQASASFFRVLASRPLLGRWISDDDDRPGAEPVVVLSEALWRRRFNASPTILSTTITLNGRPHAIVGVAPVSMAEAWRFEAWVPLAMAADQTQRRSSFLMVLARLRDGVSLADARQGMTAVAAGLTRDHPLDRYGFNILTLHDVVTRGPRQALWVLLAATGLVLLIACANVSNLLLARAVSRQKEVAVRVSLGAGRLRLVRQLLTETVLLALVGGAAGLALAAALLRAFTLVAPANFPRLATVHLDWRVLLVSMSVAAAAGVLAGLLPALQVLRASPNEALRDGARGATAAHGARRASRWLVVSEIALAVVLVATAGLALRGLDRLLNEDLGITRESVLTFAVALPSASDAERDRAARLFQELEDRVASLPAVSRAGAINMLPIAATGMNGQVQLRDRPLAREEAPLAEFRVVTPGYFEALGVRLVAGRLPDRRDAAGAPLVVVINETLAGILWPGQPPSAVLGQLMGTGFDDGSLWREVIGIVRDVRSRRPEMPPDAETYVPHAQYPLPTMTFTVKTAGPPEALVPQVRAELAQLNPNLPLAAVRTMEEVVTTATRASRLYSALAALFAVLAGVLAVVGIYSVMSYSVAQRTRELAVRAALGATTHGLRRMIMREGLAVSAVGIVLGVAGGLAAARLLGSLLYEVSPSDPLVFVVTTVLVTATAAAGCLLPARRAARVPPAEALREA